MTKPITTRILDNQTQQVSFLVDNKELISQLRSLKKVNKLALEKLEHLLETCEDPVIILKGIDIATRLMADAIKAQANDHLQKLCGQARLGMQSNTKQLVNDDVDRPKRPVIDFSTIKEIT